MYSPVEAETLQHPDPRSKQSYKMSLGGHIGLYALIHGMQYEHNF
jgi:hypothetical protein